MEAQMQKVVALYQHHFAKIAELNAEYQTLEASGAPADQLEVVDAAIIAESETAVQQFMGMLNNVYDPATATPEYTAFVETARQIVASGKRETEEVNELKTLLARMVQSLIGNQEK